MSTSPLKVSFKKKKKWVKLQGAKVTRNFVMAMPPGLAYQELYLWEIYAYQKGSKLKLVLSTGEYPGNCRTNHTEVLKTGLELIWRARVFALAFLRSGGGATVSFRPTDSSHLPRDHSML